MQMDFVVSAYGTRWIENRINYSVQSSRIPGGVILANYFDSAQWNVLRIPTVFILKCACTVTFYDYTAAVGAGGSSARTSCAVRDKFLCYYVCRVFSDARSFAAYRSYRLKTSFARKIIFGCAAVHNAKIGVSVKIAASENNDATNATGNVTQLGRKFISANYC